MKPTINNFFLLPLLFIFSCSGLRSSRDYKVVLELSVNSYIKSLTKGKILLPDVSKNKISAASSDEQLMDAFIDSISREKSAGWLLGVFAENEMLPKFESTATLKNFLFADYNRRINRMREVIANRIFNFTGTPKDKIQIEQTKNQITIIIPDVAEEANIKAAFENRDGINFWEVQRLSEIGEYIAKLNDSLSGLAKKEIQPVDTGKEMSLTEAMEQGEQQKTDKGLFEFLAPAIDASGRDYGSAFWGMAAAKDTAKINAIFAGPVAGAVFPKNVKMLWGTVPGRHGDANGVLGLYAIKPESHNEPLVDGDDIKNAKFDFNDGRSEISIEMNARGTVKWANATQKCTGKPIAMEMNGFVLSAPNVNEKISGGRSSITGDFTAKEGDMLARAIRSGRFPLSFRIVSIEQCNTQK